MFKDNKNIYSSKMYKYMRFSFKLIIINFTWEFIDKINLNIFKQLILFYE